MYTSASDHQDKTHPDKKYDNVQRTFWRYALPSITALLVSGLYEIIDGIFVGQYIGYEGLAAINVAWPIIFVVVGIGFLIGIGSGSLISIHRGKQQPLEAQAILNTSVTLVLLFSLLCTGLMLWLDTPLLQLQNASGNPLSMALEYTEVFAIGSAITLLATALPMMIRNDDSPFVATGLLLMGAVLNILLDYLFMVQLGWGIRGAALATLSAQACVTLGALLYFTRFSNGLRFSRQLFSPCIRTCGRILLLGSSTFVMYLYASFDVALHNRLFMEYGNELIVGAYAIVGYLMMLFYLLSEGISDGMQPPVSYYFGSNRPRHMRSTVKLAVALIMAIGLGWTLFLSLMPAPVVSLFSDGNAALQDTASEGIRLHLFALALDGLIVLAAVYFTAVDQGRKALIISVSNIAIQLPFLLILPMFLGITGIWLALPVSTAVLFLVVAPMLWYDLRKRVRQHKAVAA